MPPQEFVRWMRGGSYLINLHPELTFLDHAPNIAELLLLSILLTIAGAMINISLGQTFLLAVGSRQGDARAVETNSTLTGMRWVLAGVEATFIRFVGEVAWLASQVERKDFYLIGRRFEWNAFRLGSGPMNERRKTSRQRFLTVISIMVLSLEKLLEKGYHHCLSC